MRAEAPQALRYQWVCLANDRAHARKAANNERTRRTGQDIAAPQEDRRQNDQKLGDSDRKPSEIINYKNNWRVSTHYTTTRQRRYHL